MNTTNLEDRVTILETQFAQFLQMVQHNLPRNAWRGDVGMFADDPQIEQLHRETHRIREEDRTATRASTQGGT